jgi:hypothetical protein
MAEERDREGPVDIGTHKLWLYARGNRAPGDPAVIIIQGLGSVRLFLK